MAVRHVVCDGPYLVSCREGSGGDDGAAWDGILPAGAEGIGEVLQDGGVGVAVQAASGVDGDTGSDMLVGGFPTPGFDELDEVGHQSGPRLVEGEGWYWRVS